MYDFFLREKMVVIHKLISTVFLIKSYYSLHLDFIIVYVF